MHVYDRAPRNVYWEMTIACDLACKHCRASAVSTRHPDELTTEEAFALVREVKALGSLLVLTGGDPMKREDIFAIIEYARSLHVPVAVTPSTTPTVTRDVMRRFRDLGLAAVGVSVDGPTAETHDSFRGVPGTFDQSMRVLGWAREFKLPVQINTTVTQQTLARLPEMYRLLSEENTPPVKRWSLFALVPVGRGVELGLPTADEMEGLFAWVYDRSKEAPFHISAVEAPQYRRYWAERKLAEGASHAELARLGKRMGFGLRDGNGVVFVSHRGEVLPAGFLPWEIGNVHDTPLTELYRDSPRLRQLRDMDALGGKCGACSYRWLCGGSRARAFGLTGNVMAADPQCAYEPASDPHPWPAPALPEST